MAWSLLLALLSWLCCGRTPPAVKREAEEDWGNKGRSHRQCSVRRGYIARISPPRSVEELDACFVVKDIAGQIKIN